MRTLIFSFIALIFLLQTASAQALQPGNVTFEILGINVTPLCDPDEDFTGTCQYLALYGDLSYLNVKWTTYYADGIEREIGVDCYLNCPSPGADIDANCLAYKNSTNYCNYKAKVGYGFCTIVKPNYLFKNQLNNVTCKFYDPSRPDIKFLPYLNRTFYPTRFDIFTTLEGAATVGKAFTLGLNIRNLGLLISNFTSNVSAMLNPYLVVIENPVSQTDQLKYDQIGKLYPKITFLSAEKINFKVLTKSNIDPTSCSDDAGCTYLGTAECIDSRCWEKRIVTISAGKSSLPEFGWTGLIQIMILSAAVIFLFKNKD